MTTLASLDGPVVVGGALIALMLLVAVVCVAWESTSPTPRRESLSERHDRLDAEALACTRPVSSSRKSGRVRAGGAS